MTEDSKRRWHPSAGLTLFGRKPALEALMDPLLEIHCLHLANSNRSGGIITQIMTEAERRGLTLHFAHEALESQQQNGLGCDAWYRLEAGAVELWFRGEIEDDGGCHVLHGPYQGVEAPSDDEDPEVLRMPHY